MTVCADTCPWFYVVYTDDVRQEPRHILSWQYDQELTSLANRRFCVVLANQWLVAATADNARSALDQLVTLANHLVVEKLKPVHEFFL